MRSTTPAVALSRTSLLALALTACQGQPQGVEAELSELPTAGSAVVSGQPASNDQIFGTVALASPGGGSFCTGTLIAPRVVVTAAHCVQQGSTTPPSQVEVVAGVLNADNAGFSSRFSVGAVVPHPQYSSGGFGFDSYGVGTSYDIAILLMNEQVTTVTPVPILPMASFDSEVSAGTNVVISGYGLTSVNGFGGGTLYIAQTPFSHRSSTEFMAGQPGSPDTCNGDSGGPAYAVVDGGLNLIGATSRAAWTSQQSCGDGGIYSLVPAFESWIIDNAQGLYTGDGTTPVDPGPTPGDGDGDVGNPGSCEGYCGGEAPSGCWCDDSCAQYGDCCADLEAVCLGGGTEPGPGPDTGSWTCDPNWISDGECDCGCGTQDTDCTQGVIGECLYNHCPGGEDLNPDNPALCGADPGGDVGGDGDGDTGSDGDGDASGWTCDPTWQGDGACDCGCGVQDSDCAENAIELCEYSGCGEGVLPTTDDPTQCDDGSGSGGDGSGGDDDLGGDGGGSGDGDTGGDGDLGGDGDGDLGGDGDGDLGGDGDGDDEVVDGNVDDDPGTTPDPLPPPSVDDNDADRELALDEDVDSGCQSAGFGGSPLASLALGLGLLTFRRRRR